CLQLDMGNSSTKWRLLEEGSATRRGRYRIDDPDSLENFLACSSQIEQIWISSVLKTESEERQANLMLERWGVTPWFARSIPECDGFRNSYAEPARLGVDRWLSMLAVWRRLRGRGCVIDVGTTMTCDLITDEGRHDGGYIIPGAALMEHALLRETDRVRFAEEANLSLAPGRSTAEAVRHGVTLAQVGAAVLAVDRASIAPAQLFFSGGGGETVMQLAGKGGSYLPDLVFEGLEVMAQHID
ncbi:MAG: type III pantothenate kinase, partial [Pseudomonadota bacterium]